MLQNRQTGIVPIRRVRHLYLIHQFNPILLPGAAAVAAAPFNRLILRFSSVPLSKNMLSDSTMLLQWDKKNDSIVE